jgi:hypothetical protein
VTSLGACFSTTDWNAIGACGQWANAFFQLLTAIALIWLAWRTYSDSKKQNKIGIIKYKNDMINDWNKTLMSRKELISKFSEIRNPVLDHESDNMIFMYLNYAHTIWYMRKENLMDSKLADAVLDNTGDIVSGVPRAALDKILARGYEPEFISEINRYADIWRRRLAASGASAKDGREMATGPKK